MKEDVEQRLHELHHVTFSLGGPLSLAGHASEYPDAKYPDGGSCPRLSIRCSPVAEPWWLRAGRTPAAVTRRGYVGRADAGRGIRLKFNELRGFCRMRASGR
jgi:hypothetical protein